MSIFRELRKPYRIGVSAGQVKMFLLCFHTRWLR